MAKVTINGNEYDFEDGVNLVDAAESVGVEIPHYCYHPGLSIAGQCRMCYVEQPGNPKLQVACNMKCHDGMEVVTDSEKVTTAVQSSLEFHLINHPIDCPICDQAGECGLQEYYMQHGKYESEMREHKVNKAKAQDLGEKIVLDKERCILCSRCVRFTDEVSKTGQLGIFNRGDRSVIGTKNDEEFTDPYQLNTVDICPVGALTSKDFRFEQRVWFLKESESVCNGCSKGCNVYAHHKSGKHVYRLKPRYNAEVNEWWMCDEGRMTYKWANYDKRLTQARLGGVELPMADALESWVADLKTLLATERTEEVGIWMAPDFTNEEYASIFKCFQSEFSINGFFSEDLEQIVSSDECVDGFLRMKDPYSNTRGLIEAAKTAGVKIRKTDELVSSLGSGQITHLILFVPEKNVAYEALNRLANTLSPDVFTTILTPQLEATEFFANALALPLLSHYEKEGHLVNHQGRKQEVRSDFRMFKSPLSVQEVLENLKSEYKRPSHSERIVS